jgi:superfamily II DNA or RNA helicase
MIRITFDRGTLVLEPVASSPDENAAPSAARTAAAVDAIVALRLPDVERDVRIGAARAPARAYRDVVMALRRLGIEYRDEARAYPELALRSRVEREPYPYQQEAVEAFFASGGRGVVVLPTGAGKTFVAQLVIERAQRGALVVTPTIDLMQQWYSVLGTAFDVEIGLIGGGYHELGSLTVTTYDSAYIHMERYGNRFGVVVFDECHHLPSPSLALAAESCLAPYRLGLTATPERDDGLDRRLDLLIGGVAYRRDIKELSGDYLAEYETERLTVRLGDAEKERYDELRAFYRDYLAEKGVRLGSQDGFRRFLWFSNHDPEGRRAYLAYREQKRIAEGSEAKLALLEKLLVRHRGDRAIVFTVDNATVHEIARRYLIPVITHETKVKERKAILGGFNSGEYPFLATSKVLNEGVDVPAANVAIVLSGSGSVREHVQRLGRILRRKEGKRARLYEIVAEGTAEEFVSTRRRQHDAYR